MPTQLSIDHLQLIARLIADGAFRRASYKMHDPAQAFAELSFDDVNVSGFAMQKMSSNLAKESTARDLYILGAFKLAGLDYKNPFDWQTVLGAFCQHYFRRPSTKTVTWDDEAKKKVRSDIKLLKSKKPNLKKKVEIATYLKRHHPDYKRYGIDHIKRMIRESTDPVRNLDLRYPDIASPLLREIRAEFEGRGVEWTPQHHAEQSELVELFEKSLAEAREGFNKPE